MDFLRLNLALAPRRIKEAAYKLWVRLQLEYAAPIWHSYQSAEDSNHVDLQAIEVQE